MKKIFSLFLYLALMTLVIGSSAWSILICKETENGSGVANNSEVNLRIHELKQSTNNDIVTTFYVPESVTVNETSFISPTDSNGNTEYEEYGKLGNGYTDLTFDKKPFYYNIDEQGKYKKIVTHDSTGPKAITNRRNNITVNSWKNASSSDTWGDVWNVGFGNTRFYFFDACEDNFSFKRAHDKGSVIYNDPNPIYDSGEIVLENEGIIKTEKIYERCIVTDYLEQKRGKKFAGIVKYVYGYYYPTYQYRKVVTTQKIKKITESESTHSVKVKINSKITKMNLALENYEQCAFYKDRDCTKLFDFEQKITTDTDIYVKYFEKNVNNLASKIINTASGGSINCYDQNTGGTSGGSNYDYDIFTDPYYDNCIKTCFVGTTTINRNVNLNLTFRNCQNYISPINGLISGSLGEHRTSSDSNVNEKYSSNTLIENKNRSTSIALFGDMTVKGNLTIGAHIGGLTSYTKYSYIIGQYSCLDLYGNNLIVDGGTLAIYGVIQDSVGGGKVIVKNSGKVIGTLSVLDGRSTRQMILGISKRQSPFTSYFFPYIRVPISFANGCMLCGYLKFEMGEFGIQNFVINFIGSVDSLFMWKDNNTNSNVYFIPKKNEYLDNDKKALYDGYNYKNCFIFNANINQNYKVSLDVTITLSLGSAKASVDFGRIDFPISPFFKIVVASGMNFAISSKITFYPGSSLIVEKDARISFGFSGKVKYDDVGAVGKTILPGETRYLVGGLMSYTSRIADLSSNGYNQEIFTSIPYNDVDFWKYTKFANLNIIGNVVFDSSLNTSSYKNDAFYFLSGEINLSKDALISLIHSKEKIKTYDVKAELNGGHLFQQMDIDPKFQYERACSYNLNPLISNGKSYIIDSSFCLNGSFKNGVFNAESSLTLVDGKIAKEVLAKKYYLEMDSDMYEDGSSSNNQKSRIDREITITPIQGHNEKYFLIIDEKGNKKVFYKGIFVPVLNSNLDLNSTMINATNLNVNLRKFMSNSGTSVEENAAKYDNCIVSWNGQGWKYVEFSTQA